MTVARAGKSLVFCGLAMAGALLMLAALATPAKSAFFDEGIVKVNGYGWTSDPVQVQLADIEPTNDGTTTFTVRDILQKADPTSAEFNVDTVPGVSVNLPSSGQVSCTGNQMRAESSTCPIFRSTAGYTEISFVKGGKTRTARFKEFNPEIYITEARELSVTLAPATRTIKSGESVTFKATVSGAASKVTYDWNFGDGSTDSTSNGSISHKFTGTDRSFLVVVTVSASGQRGDDSGAKITIGKVEKKKKPKKEKPRNEDPPVDNDEDYDPGYVPGYGDYYDDGSGTGTGEPSTGTSPATPDQKQPEDEPQPVEDRGETVSGQLINPEQITTVLPTTETPATGSAEAAPVEEEASDGGFGISKGMGTALGIGALLGLGGLVEAGAFSGALRRFRLRP